jgi:ribosomal protein S18 acetylase RimI-like enzyme
MLPPLRRLEPQEWQLLRLARLTALEDSPDAFLATHPREKGYGPERWQEEFDRGEWFIRERGKSVICMAGVTRECGASSDERYLEYVWVARKYRRTRVAYDMVSEILGQLKESGIRTVLLYVLEGNEPATWLYKRLNFQSTDFKQPLPDNPARHEELLRRDLTER